MDQYLTRSRAAPMELDNVSTLDYSLGMRNIPFDMNTVYVNGTNRTITVVHRNGMHWCIPPTRGIAKDGYFRVRISYRFNREVFNDTRHISNGPDEDDPNELQILKNGLFAMEEGNVLYNSPGALGVEHRITAEEILARGGNVYAANLDLVLSTEEDPLAVAEHLYSVVASRQQLIEADESINSKDSFGYSVRIVDKNGSFGPRFINVNGKVYKVPVSHDRSLQDGVYVTSSGEISGDYDYSVPGVKRYSFEEAEAKVGLYKNHNDALVYGDVIEMEKRKLEEVAAQNKLMEQKLRMERMEREAELDKLKNEMEKEKARLEQSLAESKALIERREYEIKQARDELEHQRKLEALQAKNEQEQRSYVRKDTSEVLKFIPLLFTGIIAAFVAIAKIWG